MIRREHSLQLISFDLRSTTKTTGVLREVKSINGSTKRLLSSRIESGAVDL